jgi:hypothetical protein
VAGAVGRADGKLSSRHSPPSQKSLATSYSGKYRCPEIVQRDAPYDEVTPCLACRQLEAFREQLLQRFGLYQGRIVATSTRVREGPGPALVAVSEQPTSRGR